MTESKKEKRYYFLKIEGNYFRTKEIKKLRKIAGGDTFTIIYLKMQLLSLENKGVLIHEGIEEDLAKELALELDERVEDIKMTLAFLQANRMIEQINDYEYFLNRVPETITTETAAAKRMRLSRQRNKENRNFVTPLLHSVTPCSEDIDIEQDTDKELDTDTNTKKVVEAPHKEIIDLYNNICISFNSVKQITAKRKGNINARFKENGKSVNVFKEVFKKMQSSTFLKGGWNTGGKADFDWVIRPTNFINVLEGKYNQERGEEVGKYGNKIQFKPTERNANNKSESAGCEELI